MWNPMKRKPVRALLALLCAAPSCGHGGADLTLYLCPSFTADNSSAFLIDETCVPLGSFTRGACYDTSFSVQPGTHVIAHCSHCPDDCGPVGVFTTPPAHGPTVYSGIRFFAPEGPDCEAPSNCP